jgi:tripartite-type tricarboxylate transporter receptor subunit TctC
MRKLIALALLQGSLAAAQVYPSKPVKMLLPVPPGAGTDVVARTVADKFQAKFGQPFVVEHRGGAGGNIAAELVFKAPPDGYTLFLTGQGPLVINKALYGNVAYDPAAFVPISLLASGLSVLVVHPRVPASTVPQLIAHAKANPGRLNYASSGSGTIPHLAGELFKAMAGVNIVHVPYKGMGGALADVLGGQVDMMFAGLSSSQPLIREGKLRLIANGGEKRNAALPDTPTVAETLPGFAAENWFGLVAPPGTPAAIARQLSLAAAEAMKQPDVVKRFLTISFDAIGGSPEDLAALMRADSERWAKVIRSTGAKPE